MEGVVAEVDLAMLRDDVRLGLALVGRSARLRRAAPVSLELQQKSLRDKGRARTT